MKSFNEWKSFEKGASYSLKRSSRGFYYVRRVYGSFSRSSTEVKQLQSEVALLKNHKSQSEQKAASLQYEIETLTQSSKYLKTENESLQNEMQNFIQTSNSLKKENESMKNEMKRMSQTTNSLKNENEALKNKIRDAESSCENGYGRLNDKCLEIDEFCKNRPGTGQCCSNGFKSTCNDIDECKAGTHTCDANANCINSQGSFECICDTDRGFYGNGEICTEKVSILPPLPPLPPIVYIIVRLISGRRNRQNIFLETIFLIPFSKSDQRTFLIMRTSKLRSECLEIRFQNFVQILKCVDGAY